jgi:hypothetical protein
MICISEKHPRHKKNSFFGSPLVRFGCAICFIGKKLNVFRTDSEELGNKNCAPAVASSGPAAMPSISGGSRSATLPRNRSADSHSLRTDSDGAESTMERSLALLTAQYEKNNRNSLNSQVSRRLFLSATVQPVLWNRRFRFRLLKSYGFGSGFGSDS